MIRPMEESDREAVINILYSTQMFTGNELSVAEELIENYLTEKERNDYSCVVIEDKKHGVAGYMTYGPTPLAEGVFDLYWIAILPGEQRHGYGKALLEWLEGKVVEMKGRMILIETSSQPKYGSTMKFYAQNGYREIARIPDFYRKGDDRIIYAKYFN